ncbi:DUF2170 family protein [Arhodomonas sp. AD133]|uniref:DUF2170 family protein n=1 Tax=Arhodomonas sp. AD133 TaxID=3415009 RepID=UPI003EBE24B7
MTESLQAVEQRLAEHIAAEALALTVESPDEGEVLRVRLAEYEDLPVTVVAQPAEVLCMVPLFERGEIAPGKEAECMQAMLELSTALPLSFCAAYRSRYWLMGAVKGDATGEEIAHEVITLVHNTEDAVVRLAEYMQ